MYDKFISGHRNYHVKGINSFLIRESKPGESRLLRVFQATDGCASWLIQYGDYTIAPHNHSFALKLYLMFGTAYNVEFKEMRGWGCNDYRYLVNPTDSGFNLNDSEPTTLLVDQIRKIPSSGISIESKTVHSIVAESGSVWLTVETDTPKIPEKLFLYSKHPDFSLVNPDLYQPMSDGELLSYQYILDAAKATMHREGIT